VHEIAQLRGREGVAFDVCDKRAVPVEDGCSHRVVHQAFAREGINAKHPTDPCDFLRLSGEEMPRPGIGLPLTRIPGQDVGPIAEWVECHREEYEVPAKFTREALLENGEIVGAS
jgi:hypothetical protein